MSNSLPVVTRGKAKDRGTFPLSHYSYSTFVKFSTNPLMFKIHYLNGDVIETTRSISSVIGQAFHNALETYYSTDPEKAIEQGLNAGSYFLSEYPEGFIEFNTRVTTKQKALEIFAFAFACYVQETPRDIKDSIDVELELEHTVEIEYQGQRLAFPVPLKGRLDRLVRRASDGKLVIYDPKCVASFSDPDKIDGAKIVQAIQYYFLVYAELGEAPYSMIYEEVKNTKNREGGPQVQRYEIVYTDVPQFFEFYLRLYEDMTRAINGEMVYVPNLHSMYDNEVSIIAYIHRLDMSEEAAKQMEKLQVTTITDLLKAKIESAGNMRKLMESLESKFVSATTLNYNDMTTEQKIQTKLMEHGLLLKFDSKVEGHSVELYRYTPSIGLKMSKLKSYVSDVEQVVGRTGVRVLSPIPNTSFVGFEVPKAERLPSPMLPDLKVDGYTLNMGLDLYGKNYLFDITKAPHMLVAGATGAGKSVFLNTIITQLTKCANTELFLFDPKLVELSQYKEKALLYSSDPHEMLEVLEQLVVFMNRRYKDMQEQGEREWTGSRTFVVIDEFGDLTASKLTREDTTTNLETGKTKVTKVNVSEEITRNVLLLAQKARAAGIHLIIATQRPSVDVITGTIKANFPTKVAFRTAKEVDSRVLLDAPGAEKLLGRGDMIFSSEQGEVRLQGFRV